MHSVFCTSRFGFFTLIKSIAFRSQKKKKVLLFGEYFDNFRNLTGFLSLSVLACCRMIHC